MRVREQTTLAIIVTAMLSAGAAHMARGDGRLSADDAAGALCCDERLAAKAAATTLCSDGTLASNAGEVAAASEGPAARVAAALPRAARATGSPALHTATPARPLHHHLHHGALAARHGGHRHATPELRAHRQALRPAGGVPAPSAPARESHPRAALPMLVRPAHHPTWGGGSRLACALTASSGMPSTNATTLAPEEDARVPDRGHEANEARGPPRSERTALIPPAFARSLPFLQLARSSRTPSGSIPTARPTPEPDRVCFAARVPRAPAPHSWTSAAPARSPARSPAFTFVVPALPLGRADARRTESAAACSSRLSSGGVPCTAGI